MLFTKGAYLALMVPLKVGNEAPVIKAFCLLKEDGEGLSVSSEEGDEPGGKGVWHGLSMVSGGSKQFIGVDRVGWSPNNSIHK